MCGGDVRSILLLALVARYIETIDVCTVYTRILAKCKTHTKKIIEGLLKCLYAHNNNKKNHNFYTKLNGSAYMRSG